MQAEANQMSEQAAGKTLAAVAAESPGAVSALERHGLDYCCGGGESFADACRRKGLEPQAVLNEIAQSQPVPGATWRTCPAYHRPAP
jgi:regulator of cell morphogenesis and NO signaling